MNVDWNYQISLELEWRGVVQRLLSSAFKSSAGLRGQHPRGPDPGIRALAAGAEPVDGALEAVVGAE